MTGNHPGWLNEENLDHADSRPPSGFDRRLMPELPELPDYLKLKAPKSKPEEPH